MLARTPHSPWETPAERPHLDSPNTRKTTTQLLGCELLVSACASERVASAVEVGQPHPQHSHPPRLWDIHPPHRLRLIGPFQELPLKLLPSRA
jgi:hypothetical protein